MPGIDIQVIRGIPFRAHLEFKKADLDVRHDLYLKIAEQIWNL